MAIGPADASLADVRMLREVARSIVVNTLLLDLIFCRPLFRVEWLHC
jgi:hypothetical protein